MSTDRSAGPFRTVPFRPERNATLDTLRWAKKRHQIPVLIEVDVTRARAEIRSFRNETGRPLGFTAWVVSCVARAASEHPRVHSLRRGRGRLILFGEVDVAVLVERSIGEAGQSETLPMPVVIRKANEKSASRIQEELRRAQETGVACGNSSIDSYAPAWLSSLFFRLPAWARDAVLWRWLLRSPVRIKRTMGTVVVSSAGVTTPGILSWGIPASVHPLAIGVGGIAERATTAGVAEILALTIVFDHEVTDGAPVGRFVRRLHELMTGAEALKGERMRVRAEQASGGPNPGELES